MLCTVMTVQTVPKCVERPALAESITTTWRERKGEREMKQRTQGLTPPTDIVISSFSHHIEDEGNNEQHTCSLGGLTKSSTVSSFSKQKKGEKIKERDKQKEGRGERYAQQGR